MSKKFHIFGFLVFDPDHPPGIDNNNRLNEEVDGTVPDALQRIVDNSLNDPPPPHRGYNYYHITRVDQGRRKPVFSGMLKEVKKKLATLKRLTRN